MDNSNSDCQEIFFGPITKREIISKLKHFDLYNDDLLEPLKKLQDNDALDDILIKFYYEDVFPECETEENSTCLESSSLKFNMSNGEYLTESQLLKYIDDVSISSDSLSITQNKLRKQGTIEERVSSHECKEVSNEDSSGPLNIEHLDLSAGELNSHVSKASKSVQESESLHQNNNHMYSIPNEDTLNTTIEHFNLVTDESKSQNSTHQEHESVSLNSTYESSEYSHTPISEKSCSFNCTLEEMEMLMKFGENYINRSSLNKQNENDNSCLEKEHSFPVTLNQQNITEENEENNSYSNKENCLAKATCSKKQLIPSYNDLPDQVERKITTKLNKKILSVSKIPEVKLRIPKQVNCLKSPSPFKVPTKSTSVKKSPSYKNIVSPIALYIKNSPQVPLVQNIVKKTVQANILREINRTENTTGNSEQKRKPVLPVRSYKPAARTILLSKDGEPTMPKNIRKLIKGPLNPEIIKHVGRINDNIQTRPNSNSEDNDFTILSSTIDSSAYVQRDVSVHVSKNAARTNRLQKS